MKVLVIFGGASFEHEISIVSAISLKNVIKEELVFVFLDADRQFYLVDEASMKSKFFATGKYKKATKLRLFTNGFYKKGFFTESWIDYDVMINLCHGGDGEDGKLSGMLEFYGVPFVGPRVDACAVSYSKKMTKYYAAGCGVKTLSFETVHKNSNYSIKTPYPFIVKPVRLGSSIGVSVVKSESELSYALDVGFEFDDELLIEPFIEGVKEYNLAGCFGDTWHFSLIEEVEKHEFLDFDKKYFDFSRSKRVKEAEISEEMAAKFKEAFKKVYDLTFSGSLIRCDFFEIDGEVYLNEINPIPGSMANYLFTDFDTTLSKLISNLPYPRKIEVDYRYINHIQAAKGKV